LVSLAEICVKNTQSQFLGDKHLQMEIRYMNSFEQSVGENLFIL
jgi:hypothetical protein